MRDHTEQRKTLAGAVLRTSFVGHPARVSVAGGCEGTNAGSRLGGASEIDIRPDCDASCERSGRRGSNDGGVVPERETVRTTADVREGCEGRGATDGAGADHAAAGLETAAAVQIVSAVAFGGEFRALGLRLGACLYFKRIRIRTYQREHIPSQRSKHYMPRSSFHFYPHSSQSSEHELAKHPKHSPSKPSFPPSFRE